MQTQRRNALKKLFATVTGTLGIGLLANAKTTASSAKEKEVFNVVDGQDRALLVEKTDLTRLTAPFEFAIVDKVHRLIRTFCDATGF